jgi:hypothetical protein
MHLRSFSTPVREKLSMLETGERAAVRGRQ